MTALLELDDVAKTFGGLKAVDGVSMSVEDGGFLGLIGPNGAGKTTLLNVMSGYLPVTSGRIRFAGEDMTDWPSWRRARRGVVRTYQSNRLLSGRSVSDHMNLALQAADDPHVRATLRRAFSRFRTRDAAVMDALEPFGMQDLVMERADQLSHGHQRLLGIAMSVTACHTRPAVLLLDEPVTGMNDVEVGFALDVLRGLRSDGFTLVLVEHNMRAVMSAVDRVFVVDVGRKLAEGAPTEVASDPRVIEAYLGAPYAGEAS